MGLYIYIVQPFMSLASILNFLQFHTFFTRLLDDLIRVIVTTDSIPKSDFLRGCFFMGDNGERERERERVMSWWVGTVLSPNSRGREGRRERGSFGP
jgi:hypothetical protein